MSDWDHFKKTSLFPEKLSCLAQGWVSIPVHSKGHPSSSCWYLQCQCANDTAHPRWHCAKYIEHIIYNRNFPNIQIYLNSKTGKECQVTARVLFNKLLHNLFVLFFLFAIAVDWFLPKKTQNNNQPKNQDLFLFVKACISLTLPYKISALFYNAKNCSCLHKELTKLFWAVVFL